MFTGIVVELGVVVVVKTDDAGSNGATVTILSERVSKNSRPGDSVAVNGCCVTATEITDSGFLAHLMPETLRLTTFRTAAAGQHVNIELAARLGDPIGGHPISGHVDGVATLLRRNNFSDGSAEVAFALPSGLGRYVVEKGSICLDGVSLTVIKDAGDECVVGLIPHTLANTTLGDLEIGGKVNVEIDQMARYIEKFIGGK